MKKTMPKNVSVMGRIIPIKYVTKASMEKFIKDAEGVWDSYERCIYINREAPRNIQLYYIYHEVTHAMHTFTGIDQMLPNEFVEILCQTSATLIEDILNQSGKMK
jgi:Zn-dependent peptidase ImmA (M78 family)